MLGHPRIPHYSSIPSGRYCDNVTGADNQQERLSSNESRRWFVAGVVEGEGSWCLSIKRHPTATLGFYVQPEFFVYQHRRRRELLETVQEVFGCGRIWPKPGNPDVLVFAINSRANISAHVLPFMRRYMRFSSRRSDMELFEDAMGLFERGLHRQPEGLATIVRIAYAMNGDGKQRRRSIDEVLDRILRGHTLNARAQGEDMVRPPRRRGELGGTETT
jgi:LAGLIDADG endonuclease